jgi:hypothetical protein
VEEVPEANGTSVPKANFTPARYNFPVLVRLCSYQRSSLPIGSRWRKSSGANPGSRITRSVR